MYARVVRFTDVTSERISEIVSTIESADGPPPGVDSSRIQVFFDEAQETAIFVVHFDDEEKLRAGDRTLEEMNPEDPPGNRASVDLCELKIERTPDT